MLADAIDTMDKCITDIRHNGEDESLSDRIRRSLGNSAGVEKHLGINDHDIMNTIYAASIDAEEPRRWPSCSQRRFLEYQGGDYPLFNHVRLVRHIKGETLRPNGIKLSCECIPSDKFYDAFKKRLKDMIIKKIITKEQFHHEKVVDYILSVQ
jgi:hypothetical protein